MLTVLPHPRVRGVAAPGYRDQTHDWRAPKGSPENTARVDACGTLTSLDEAMHGQYLTDAHAVSYTLWHTGVQLDRTPRINKTGLPWLESQGYELRVEVLFADVDNDGHAAWNRELLDAYQTLWSSSKTQGLQHCGRYLTNHGYRVVWLCDKTCPVKDAEGLIRCCWSHLAEAGIKADPACKDWTRLYRLPRVQRNGRPTTPLLPISMPTVGGAPIRPLALPPRPQRKRGRKPGPKDQPRKSRRGYCLPMQLS